MVHCSRYSHENSDFFTRFNFEEAEALAQELAISRSELYTKAPKAYLQQRNRSQMLEKLNEIYSEVYSELDPVLAEMQWMVLAREEW